MRRRFGAMARKRSGTALGALEMGILTVPPPAARWRVDYYDFAVL
jgi:hypothetical protein